MVTWIAPRDARRENSTLVENDVSEPTWTPSAFPENVRINRLAGIEGHHGTPSQRGGDGRPLRLTVVVAPASQRIGTVGDAAARVGRSRWVRDGRPVFRRRMVGQREEDICERNACRLAVAAEASIDARRDHRRSLLGHAGRPEARRRPQARVRQMSRRLDLLGDGRERPPGRDLVTPRRVRRKLQLFFERDGEVGQEATALGGQRTRIRGAPRALAGPACRGRQQA